jgi:hypothetical protein
MRQRRIFQQYGLKSRVKTLAKKVLKQLIPLLVARPTLRALATQLAHHLGVVDRLKPFVRSCLVTSQFANKSAGADNSLSAPIKDLVNLPPRARQIFADLKVAIEEQKKG